MNAHPVYLDEPIDTHHEKRVSAMETLFKFGAPGRIRTHDPLVRSQVLYPTELRALIKRRNYS